MAKANKPANQQTMTAAEALKGLQAVLTPAQGLQWLQDIRQNLDQKLREDNFPDDEEN